MKIVFIAAVVFQSLRSADISAQHWDRIISRIRMLAARPKCPTC